MTNPNGPSFRRPGSMHGIAPRLAAPRLVVTALAVAASAMAGRPGTADAQSWSGDWCAETDVRRNQHCEVRALSLAPHDGQLTVNARPNGGIRVESWNGDEVRVIARVVSRARSERAARDLAEDVEVRATAGSVSSHGPRTRGSNSWSVSFRVLVPQGTALDLRTSNGSIAVSGVRGAVQAQTTNGAVRLEDTAGRVRARSTNGGITTTVSRSLGPNDDLELRTTNGSIQLGLPEGVSARIEASTTNGRITTDFPIMVQGQIGRRLSGTLGDGGPEIRATTTNGGIRITQN
jgi:hypothetical protein